jgi:cyclopropane-fatty-acyl-phospholipid synthase
MPSVFSEESRLQAAARILRHFAKVLDLPISVRLWDGTNIPLGASASQNQYVSISGPAVLGSLLRRRSLDILFRHYVSGDIDLHGMDLLDCFDVIRRNKLGKVQLGDLRREFPWMAILPLVLGRHQPRELQHRFREDESQPLRSGRDNKSLIQFHYDVSNEFYALFLDAEMIYSCAYFVEWGNSLDEAQRDKLDLVCRKLRLKPGEAFLDIGSGWGALLCHAARHYGVRAHGVTLSEAQHDHTKQKIERLGLGQQVTVSLGDYMSLEGSYDKIASIGMYEHVGIANYPTYFRRIRQLLKDGGIFLNHGITRRAKRDMRKFKDVSSGRRIILNYIFPGSELDHIGHTLQEMEACGFEVHDVEGLRLHYARTCRLWYQRLLERSEEACKIVGPERYRMWAAYLAGVAGAFEQGPLCIYQTLATKRTSLGSSPLPPTRGDLYRRREAVPVGE